MKTIKWIIAGLVPAFATGSALLTAGTPVGFVFWWGVLGAFVGGLAGMGANKGVDRSQSE